MDKIIKEALKETAELYSIIICIFVVVAIFTAMFVILPALFCDTVGLFVALLFTIFGLPFVIIFMATLSEIGDNNGKY